MSERSDLEGSADSTLPDFDETTDTEVFEDPLEENVDSGVKWNSQAIIFVKIYFSNPFKLF